MCVCVCVCVCETCYMDEELAYFSVASMVGL